MARRIQGWAGVLALFVVGCEGRVGAGGDVAPGQAEGAAAAQAPALDAALVPYDAAGAAGSAALEAGAIDGGDAPADASGPGLDGALLDAGGDTLPPGSVPMFVAQGHMGRTIVSCDDGLSWVADRSIDREGDRYVCDVIEPAVCWVDGMGCNFLDDGVCVPKAAQCDCDHHPGAGTGIAYGDGWFVATWGWGPKGSVRRSQDGVSWEEVLGDTSFGGMAFGLGRFIAADRQPRRSLDDGVSWQNAGAADLQSPGGDAIWNVRAFGFAPVGGGRFVITGESGANRDVLVSADRGDSFVRPSPLPPGCAAGVTGVVGSAADIVIAHGNGDICHSHDGGASFELTSVGDTIESRPVWAGDRFMAWKYGKAYSSVDGGTWTSTATVPANLNVGAAAYSPLTGTFVAVRGGWQVWYDQQEFYRSSDGVTWTKLAASDAPGGHPIRSMVFGHGKPSAACPAP